MSAIISRRTRVSQSSHSREVKLWSINRPHSPGRGSPQGAPGPAGCEAKNARARRGGRSKNTLPAFACPGLARGVLPRLVRFAQLADEREQGQIQRDNDSANHQAQEYDHDGFEG